MTHLHPIDGKGVITNKKLICVLPLELLPVLHRGVTRGLAETLDKIVHRVEGQGFRDLLYRLIRGGEQHFGPLHLGEADIAIDGLAGLFLEFIRQIILGIAHRGQRGDARPAASRRRRCPVSAVRSAGYRSADRF